MFRAVFPPVLLMQVCLFLLFSGMCGEWDIWCDGPGHPNPGRYGIYIITLPSCQVMGSETQCEVIFCELDIHQEHVPLREGRELTCFSVQRHYRHARIKAFHLLLAALTVYFVMEIK